MYWLKSPSAYSWHFIPKNAALVLETQQTIATYDSIRKLDVWRAFDRTSFAQNIEQELANLDSVDTADFRKTFGENATLIAFFPVSANELDVLLVTEMNSSTKRNYLSRCILVYKELGYRYKTRLYNGFTIEEFYDSSDGESFSFIRFQNHFVGSFSPFLVEDAIRAFIDKEETSFSASFQETKSLKPLDYDNGNLYVNMKELRSLLNLFPNESQSVFGKSAFLDIDFTPSSIKLTGFTFPENDLLSTFISGPGSFDLLEVVPNNTAKLSHYSFQDAEAWRTKLLDFDPNIKSTTEALKLKFDVDVNFLFGQINQEVGVADLEVVDTDRPDRLVFFDTKNIDVTKDFLNQATRRMAIDSIFFDQVGNYILKKIDVGIATAMLGHRSALDQECYYMIHGKYVIMSNSLTQLKRLIQALQTDNTWRRSLLINNLLDLSSREANYTMFVHIPRSWNEFTNNLKMRWKPVFETNQVAFKSLEYLSLQFSKVDNKFYTNAIAYQPEPPKQPAKVRTVNKIPLASKVITKPYLIKSHLDQSLEVLVQDSAMQLYHLSTNFDVLWDIPLSEPIVGAIQPVDFYKNNKTQYAFCTNSQLHIIDRTGSYIDGFPISISGRNKIAHFSVVDYDGSKNYRYMITNSNGDIYLLDNNGKPLSSWAPKVVGSQLFSEPSHIRAAGRDAFIIVKRNGAINMFNRRGQANSGFPHNLKTEVVDIYFSEATGSFETSRLTTLTADGKMIRINFNGQLEFQEQLLKPDANTTFSLVKDVFENDFIIIRSSDNLWEVLDNGGAKLFEKTYIKNEPRTTQFYRFGGGKGLILVGNTEEGFLMIYDLDGKVLTQKALRSSIPVSVLFSENRNSYTLYVGYDNVIEKLEIK